MNNSTNSWIIHNIDARETSSRLIIFSEDLGLIKCSYKGNKNNRKKLIIQPFMQLSIIYVHKYKQYFVQDCELSGTQYVFSGEILFSALYMNELLSKLLSFDESNLEIYSLYADTLKKLNQLQRHDDKYAMWTILRIFEYNLLRNCGYMASFTHDMYANEIMEDKYYIFSPENGFYIGQNGIIGRIILDFSEYEIKSMQAQQILKNIMRKSVDHALGGKVLTTRKLWVSN